MFALLPFVHLNAVHAFDDVSGLCDACTRRADFVRDYAHGVGFRVGSGGEWIAEEPANAPASKRAA